MKELRNILAKTVHNILCLFQLKKIIVFESRPDFACNTYPVFRYIKEHYPEYKCVWFVKNEINNNQNLADDVVQRNDTRIKSRIKRLYYRYFATAFVSCNIYLVKEREKQISLFLTHGSKTKKTRGIYEMGDKVDYILVQSHFFDDVICYEYNAKPEQLLYLGFPRNDYFYANNKNMAEMLGLPSESKYVIWLPTFRTHKNAAKTAQSRYNDMGIPLFYTVDSLNIFNDYLRENNLYVIYKPHPAQDVSVLKATSLSNLKVINDKYLSDSNLQLAEVLAGSEALLTDYSSVYFDYILLDKPIGTTTDDIEEWKAHRGFAFDLDAMYDKSTQRIPNYDTLIEFLDNVLSGKDDNAEGRREVRELTNTYYDGNSSKRVVDFLMERIYKKGHK